MSAQPEQMDAGMQAAVDKAVADAQQKKVDEAQVSLIRRVRREIAQSFAHDEQARKRYADDRRMAAGSTEWEVDTNLIAAIIEILMAFIYAKNPDISITCSDSVGETRAKQYRDVYRTLEIVVSRLLQDARLKKKAKKWVRAAMTVGMGCLRATMQTRTEIVSDPVVQNELNDLKQQIAQLQAINKAMEDGCGDQDLLIAEKQTAMTALQASLERQIATGLVLDVIPMEDVQVAADCGELENYLDASFIRLRFYKSKAEVLDITGWDERELAGATLFYQKPRPDNGESAGSAAPTQQHYDWQIVTNAEAQTAIGFYLVEEVQHRRDGVVYTLIEGVNDRWARAPYAPRQSSRFYDVFLLGFHYIDGERHPQSDVHQLKRLQKEYGRTRSNFAEHRKRAIPAMLFDAGAISTTEADKIRTAQTGEIVGIQTSAPGDFNKLFKEKSYPQFDPRLYDVTPITQDMEKVSGAQDAMQSGIAVEKTATEAEIQNNGFGARVGTRKDEIEDVMSDLAMHVLQLALQTVDEEFARRVAGEAAVWPQLTIDDILNAFDVSVKAGSTGKPNTAAQRNAWQALLPILEKLTTVIGNFVTNPAMAWAAEPYKEMVRETARLLEYKGDVEKLIPTPPADFVPPMPGVPGDPAGAPAPLMSPALAGPAQPATP